ncbi:MAG: peptidoglycan DD-metalloendopeptidase family protein [Clostridia bacterium]|nr:peptidoglycan DD-metalloendopeptidase family protein [Clostridia bacterium]
MQKRTDYNTSVTAVIRNGFNTVKNINRKLLSTVLCAIMLISTFGIITKYYTIGYDVYYEDVNVGVISDKAEAIDAYEEAATDVARKSRARISGDLRFVMTIAPIEDITDSDIYRGIVEAAQGKEDCFCIEADGQVIARVKTREEAECAIKNYIALFNRADALIYSCYTISGDKAILTDIVSADEAVELIRESGLITVVYKDVTTTDLEIPYETTRIEDETIPEGTTVYVQKGKTGHGIRKDVVFYENGIRKHDVDTIEQTITKPCDEIVRIGTGKMKGLVEKTLPWPTEGRFTSPYGRRWGRNHNGIDLAADPGTPIYAPAKGTVIFSDTRSGYGNYIIIDHGDGFTSTYAHMTSRFVEEGCEVKQGDLIGTVGSTGRVTGPHLHFEILYNGDFVDPMDYIVG